MSVIVFLLAEVFVDVSIVTHGADGLKMAEGFGVSSFSPPY